MAIPNHIIEKLNSILGVTGRSHFVLWNGEWIDTGCMEWTISPNLNDVMSQISPDLQEALTRWQQYLIETWSQTSRSLIDAFQRWQTLIRNAIPDAKNSDLKEVSSEYDQIVEAVTQGFLEKVSPNVRFEFDNFMSQLGQKDRLYQSTYLNGTTFMGTVDAIKTAEFFAKEPNHIQKEYDALQSNIGRANQLYKTLEHSFNSETLNQVRNILRSEQLIAYKADLTELDFSNSIIVAPTIDQFDILRYEHTDAANYWLDTEEVISELKILDEKYGIDITGAGMDSVVLILKRVPQGEEANELGQWLLDFCPDLYELPEKFPEGEVFLWWD